MFPQLAFVTLPSFYEKVGVKQERKCNRPRPRSRKIQQRTTRQCMLSPPSSASSPSPSLELTASRQTTAAVDPDGDPLLHVVFVHPQIHWNTGNIGRTCLGLGARLHLIKPLGFSLDAKQIRRAGLDYWEHVDVHVYESWQHFVEGPMQEIEGTRYFFTKFGTQCATELTWESDGKIMLVFGSEVDGFDGIRDWLLGDGKDENVVAFPMVDDRFRSFNLSTTASMVRFS